MGIVALVLFSGLDPVLPWIALYIGPDVFLPLTSAIAAIVGVALMFWHRIIGLARRLFGKTPPTDSPSDPPRDR